MQNQPRRLAALVAGVAALLVAALAAILLAACSPIRAIEAVSLLADVAASGRRGEDPAKSAPRPVPVVYVAEDRLHNGDLYRADPDAAAAVVLVPGVSPDGKDDPRLVAFAKAVARAGFVVLVPDLVGLRDLKVRPSDRRDIADAVGYLADRTGPGAGATVGIIAFSYAAGPAVLAALTDDVRRRVRFVLAVGGYHDVVAMVTYFTTGYFRERPGAPWRYRPPNNYAKWVFLRSNTERLPDPADRAALFEMAERKLADPRVAVDDLAAGLGDDGRAVWALVTNRDPDKVAALIAALPEPVRLDMAALDLKGRDFSKLTARLLLIHGRDDPIIPFSESQALAAAVPADRVELYLVDALAHVDLGRIGIGDSLILWRAAYQLLRERDLAASVNPR